MNLAQVTALLGITLYASQGFTTDPSDRDLKPITVRVWHSSEIIPSGHISLETEEYYISLHSPSLLSTVFKPTKQLDATRAFATHRFQSDQEYFGDPKETYSFKLNTQPIHVMWVKIADIGPLEKWGFMDLDILGYSLPSVIYSDGSVADQNEIFYLSNKSLVKMLLHAGGMDKKSQCICD